MILDIVLIHAEYLPDHTAYLPSANSLMYLRSISFIFNRTRKKNTQKKTKLLCHLIDVNIRTATRKEILRQGKTATDDEYRLAKEWVHKYQFELFYNTHTISKRLQKANSSWLVTTIVPEWWAMNQCKIFAQIDLWKSKTYAPFRGCFKRLTLGTTTIHFFLCVFLFRCFCFLFLYIRPS